jgi:hypothetical protein
MRCEQWESLPGPESHSRVAKGEGNPVILPTNDTWEEEQFNEKE